MVQRYRWWLCFIIISRHGCHQPVWITIPPRVRVQGKWLVSHSLVVGRVGMRTINPRCVVVVVVLLHRGRWQMIVIRSERAWWQPLSCSIIVTRRHWDDRQCWRSRFNVKMLWYCTTQKDGSWSLFNVDEGKCCLPCLRDDGVAEECYTGLKTWWTSTIVPRRLPTMMKVKMKRKEKWLAYVRMSLHTNRRWVCRFLTCIILLW